MANDFSSDPNCVALWKLDNNANDAKGGNDLTPVNSPPYDSGDKKEGSYCLDLERGSQQYCTIADDDLDAGFPGKNGTSEPSFSICAWVKLESLVNTAIVSKFTYSNYSYAIYISSGGQLSFRIGYNGGANYSVIYFDTYLSTGIWYHIGVVYDSSDNGMKIRVWDDNAGALLDSNKEGTSNGDMSPSTTALEVGRVFVSDNFTFDGKIDEAVILNKVLTDADIDAIRAGTYGSGVTEKASADTGSGADTSVALETQQDKESADNGAGVEAVESLVTPEAKASSDVGSGTEGTPVASAVLEGSQSGYGIEALIARLLADDESGGASEASSLTTEELRDLLRSEAGEGLDRLIAKIETPTKGGGLKL